ncbi:MAG: hypothetical protein C0598_14685 [Marinilabiliales bacterium]|nr:MAG: hypothetical protein C0598_14685 [Marinilabiliales bacterium]
MKSKILYLGLILLVLSCSRPFESKTNWKVFNSLYLLSEQQSYFKLKTAYELNKSELSTAHTLYFEAIINRVFNNPEASNQAIENLLKLSEKPLADSLLNNIYQTKLNNHINLYEYGLAASTSEYLQQQYADFNDSIEIENLENELNMWRALASVPKQSVIINSNCVIPMIKDKVGLFNVDVNFGDSTKNLIFDTGANFSAIRRSLVSKLGLKLLESDFYVTAATGLKVASDLAVADEIELGGIICKNVVFLVLNDEDLDFPQVDYYANGAIGFPVIEAFHEIRITKENEIIVPQEPQKYTFNNFALDGLMPVLACLYNNDTLSFQFDTGATNTTLYPLFFKENKTEIENNFEKETFTTGSAGGHFDFEGYVLNHLILQVADSEASLDNVRLHIHKLGNKESNFHGNFGQDYIKQFDEMVLSFKYSSVLFN